MRENHARDPARDPCAKPLRENHPRHHAREPAAKTHPHEPARNHPRKPCARTMRENHPHEPCARPHKVYHTETTLTSLVRLHSITINGNKKNPLSSGYFRPPKMAKKKIYQIWPPKKNESTVQKTTSVPPY